MGPKSKMQGLGRGVVRSKVKGVEGFACVARSCTVVENSYHIKLIYLYTILLL